MVNLIIENNELYSCHFVFVVTLIWTGTRSYIPYLYFWLLNIVSFNKHISYDFVHYSPGYRMWFFLNAWKVKKKIPIFYACFNKFNDFIYFISLYSSRFKEWNPSIFVLYFYNFVCLLLTVLKEEHIVVIDKLVIIVESNLIVP